MDNLYLLALLCGYGVQVAPRLISELGILQNSPALVLQVMGYLKVLAGHFITEWIPEYILCN
jgi:hypothetical protein